MATKKSVSAAVEAAAKTEKTNEPKTEGAGSIFAQITTDMLRAGKYEDHEIIDALLATGESKLAYARMYLLIARKVLTAAGIQVRKLVRNDAGELVPYVKGAGKATRKPKSGEAKSALIAAGVLPASSDKSERTELIRKGLVVPAAKPTAAATKKTGK